MTKNLQLHIGGTFDTLEKRIIDAWHQAEMSEPGLPEDHLTFVTWDAFSRMMTTKRLELLRHLHRHPQASIADLARSLGRDYRRVHEDVDILVHAGLIDHTAAGLRAGYDEIRTTIAL